MRIFTSYGLTHSSVDRSYRKPENASSVLDSRSSDSNNLLPMTQRQIANKSGISYQTVSRTLQALIDSNFLQRINQGAYRVNPDVLFKGGKTARMNVLLQYHESESIESKKSDCD